MPQPQRSPTPSREGVVDRLLEEIVSGLYAAGAHLPAERDLARQLGASRPTLREALGKLTEWGLVAARRGSGIVVRDLRHWSIDVLPSFVRWRGSRRPQGDVSVGRVLVDLLDLRRVLVVDVITLVAPRLTPSALGGARAALRRAWDARLDVASFVREDFDVMREVTLAAQLLPALWLLNGLEDVYHELARRLSALHSVPDDYVATYTEVFDALERRDGSAAAAILADYFRRYDAALIHALGGRP